MAGLIIERDTRRFGSTKSEYFADIYISEHDGAFVPIDEAHAEIAKLREENQRLAKQAKIEVLEGIQANAASWHLENYGYPLRGHTGNEALAIEFCETLKQLEGEDDA